MVALPLGKLAYMGMRQLSKPIASKLKTYAKEHPVLRNTLILPTAQAYHRMGQRIRLSMMGSKSVDITPLSESAAIELGAELFGELFIFFTGAILVSLEYLRQRNATILKEQYLLERIDKLEAQMIVFETRYLKQETLLATISNQLQQNKLPATIITTDS